MPQDDQVRAAAGGARASAESCSGTSSSVSPCRAATARARSRLRRERAESGGVSLERAVPHAPGFVQHQSSPGTRCAKVRCMNASNGTCRPATRAPRCVRRSRRAGRRTAHPCCAGIGQALHAPDLQGRARSRRRRPLGRRRVLDAAVGCAVARERDQQRSRCLRPRVRRSLSLPWPIPMRRDAVADHDERLRRIVFCMGAGR